MYILNSCGPVKPLKAHFIDGSILDNILNRLVERSGEVLSPFIYLHEEVLRNYLIIAHFMFEGYLRKQLEIGSA